MPKSKWPICPICGEDLQTTSIWMKTETTFHPGNPLTTPPMRTIIDQIKRRYFCSDCEYKVLVDEDPEYGLV